MGIGRYIKRYIFCFLWVSLSASFILVFFFLAGDVSQDKAGINYALNVLKNNLNLLLISTLFLTLFYYFQTKEISSVKSLLFSFLIICIINSAILFLFYFKPKSSDINSYATGKSAYLKNIEKYSKTNIISSPEYLIKYAAFIKDKWTFQSLTIISVTSPDILTSHNAKIIKTGEDFFLFIEKPLLIETSTPKEAITIHLFKIPKTSLIFDRIISGLYKTKNQYTFYYNLKKLYSSGKRNIYYFLNAFLNTTGLGAVFLIFALVFTLSGNRILNLSLSFPAIFLSYLSIYYINKLPVYKLKFLDKGVLKTIKSGIAMAGIALIILVIAAIITRHNRKKRGNTP